MKRLPKRTKILLLAVGLILMGVAVFSFRKVFFSKHQRLEEVETEVQLLKEEKALLEKDLREAKTRDFIEKEARERLNMVYPGETVVVLPRSDQERKENLKDSKSFNLRQWVKGLL